MNILSIETSCDETAISIMKVSGGIKKPSFSILANNVSSQIDIHKEFGGVFPAVAKREHTKAIFPLTIKTLKEAKLYSENKKIIPLDKKVCKKIREICSHEQELAESLIEILPTIKKPKIDYIAVTTGPGLEPALWVGINFAKAIALAFGIPLIPTNHMEGHVLSSLFKEKKVAKGFGVQTLNKVSFPALAVLISGGHTELVLMKDFLKYKKIGQTRDDAIGEAFDKVARILDIPYPGGPEISKLAKEHRKSGLNDEINFPRPMIHSQDFDFSFSGLKTAVLYYSQKVDKTKDEIKKAIARAFEDAAADVIVHKTYKAVVKHKITTVVVGGGVAANTHIKEKLTEKLKPLKTNILFPRKDLSTDNALMIGIAGYFQSLKNKKGANLNKVRANGNWSL
jgi:N6-L-threonylcarbamoyladenine synthase